VSRTGLVSAEPTSEAPPAIATLTKVTAASRTMLQFSSRILMPGNAGGNGWFQPARLRGRNSVAPFSVKQENFEMAVLWRHQGHAFER
jgi:hypothetical protein